VKTPTWAEVERFCSADGWREVRRSGHVFYEKVLPDGTVLRTHRSFASKKTMSPGRFKAILRTQLLVSEDDFWQAVEKDEPVERPSTPPETEVTLPAYVVRVLDRELHLSHEEIAALSEDEARRLVEGHWSRPER
jgi:predicted RNA binding protein YcfA (HicA-like mRNA interferase family)